MKLKAIYASKLYRSSSRQEAIKAAINNPINMELVSQLDEYLDDDYLDEANEEQEEETKGLDSKGSEKEEKGSKVQKNKQEEPEPKEAPKKSGAKITRSPRPTEETVDTTDTQSEQAEPSESTEQAEAPKEEQSDASSSIKASEMLFNKIVPVKMIMETLKSNEDTALVDRAEINEDKKEFWIYYNDSVNLNDIMNSVIELLNASGYSYLKFNRLARSDNAIVFEILPYSNPMEPDIQDDSEEIEGIEIGESQVEES